MNTSPLHSKELIEKALKDAGLRAAVKKATGSTVDSRKGIIDSIPCWESLRSKAYSIKKETIENLDRYLIQFEENCAKNNIKVHWAADSAEAREIIFDIAVKASAKKVVKSKSLTTEEINLNSFLAEKGVEVLETDLGEYIVQLNEQIPSHLIIPAMHLSRKDIGKLFAEKLGVPYTEEPVELLKIARRILREKFLNADIGISGVNFAFASSGSFCVVENEANAHLTISLPKIHIGVMGIEKLIPDIKMLPYFLKLLPPSATGQKSSTYVNFIGGPMRKKYGEGAEEVHIVLIDNGRSGILKDPKLRETLFCIRCGACLNVCPVYQNIGGHSYGWVYMGPIGAALIPQYLGESEGRVSPFLSSLCGACGDVCPVKIQLPSHLLALRNRIVETKNNKAVERFAFRFYSALITMPKLYRILSRIPVIAQKFLPAGKGLPVPGYKDKREFPPFDKKGFKKRFKEMVNEQQR